MYLWLVELSGLSNALIKQTFTVFHKQLISEDFGFLNLLRYESLHLLFVGYTKW